MAKIIKIDPKECENLQRLSIETESRKSLIAFMIGSRMSMDSVQFENYQKEYAKYFAEYDHAKSELEKKYVMPIIGHQHVSWNLDFSTAELTITGIEE